MSLVQFRKLIQQFCKERSIRNIVEKHLRNTVENTIGNTVDELGDVSEMNLRVVSGQDGELSKLSNLRVLSTFSPLGHQHTFVQFDDTWLFLKIRSIQMTGINYDFCRH